VLGQVYCLLTVLPSLIMLLQLLIERLFALSRSVEHLGRFGVRPTRKDIPPLEHFIVQRHRRGLLVHGILLVGVCVLDEGDEVVQGSQGGFGVLPGDFLDLLFELFLEVVPLGDMVDLQADVNQSPLDPVQLLVGLLFEGALYFSGDLARTHQVLLAYAEDLDLGLGHHCEREWLILELQDLISYPLVLLYHPNLERVRRLRKISIGADNYPLVIFLLLLLIEHHRDLERDDLAFSLLEDVGVVTAFSLLDQLMPSLEGFGLEATCDFIFQGVCPETEARHGFN